MNVSKFFHNFFTTLILINVNFFATTLTNIFHLVPKIIFEIMHFISFFKLIN